METKTGIIGLALIIAGCSTTKETIPRTYEEYQVNVNQTVHVSNYVRNRIMFLYQEKSTELPMCLTGREEGEDIYLDDVALPYYFQADSVAANFSIEPCGEDYIGMVHNHPSSGICNPSIVDYLRFTGQDDARVEIVTCNHPTNPDLMMYKIFAKPPKLNVDDIIDNPINN